MPRIFPTAITGELNKRFGTEPLVIVEVEWADGTTIAYSDRKLNGEPYPYPSVLSISNFQTSLVVTGAADSRNASITLRDTDGKIKEILDTHDIHLRPVRVYLGFQGLPVSQKALMFEGLINSPITWDEGSRSLSFDVFSKLEDAQAGFTMDDGDFPNIPSSDLNKAWPLPFGTTCAQPAVRITSTLKGTLATGQGVPDPTLAERLCQAYYLVCPPPEVRTSVEIPAENVFTDDQQTAIIVRSSRWGTGTIGGDYTLNTDYSSGSGGVEQEQESVPDQSCLIRRFNEICDLLVQIQQQSIHVQDVLTIIDGENFPQNESIILRVKDVRLFGIMNGNQFTVKNMRHPASDEIHNPTCKYIEDAYTAYKQGVTLNTPLPQTVSDCYNVQLEYVQDVEAGSGASWEYYNSFESSKFIWLEPGSDVFLEDSSEIVYIVSLLPGQVLQVAANRRIGDADVLSEVPTSYYTVHEVDYGDYQVVEIHLRKDLSLYDGENWSDELFVSFESSVGPNPVDVITWLVQKYTTYQIDPVSFGSVHASLENYPANFRIVDRRSVFQLIQDIAYQFRCALVIRNNVIFLTYLAKEPDAVKVLTESDIVSNSFLFNHTPTEELVTQSEVTWQFAGEENSFTVKHNVGKYGSIVQEYDYYTQNTFSTVLKSATFWAIRRSNTWRYVEFSTPVKHLDLDIYDCVQLNVAQFPNTKVVIESTDYDIDSNTIRFKAWTPIRSGTTEPYFWAWPALQPAGSEFPLPGEDASLGDGLNLYVTPPEGHPLRAGYEEGAARLNTAGDPYPSDLDDVFPVVDCTGVADTDIQEQLEPDIIPFEPLAEDNFVDRLKDIERTFTPQGGGGGEEQECRKTVDQSLGDGPCRYRVKLTFLERFLTARRYPGDECLIPDAATNVEPCDPVTYSNCYIFSTVADAQDFRNLYVDRAIEGKYRAQAGSTVTTGAMDLFNRTVDSSGFINSDETEGEKPLWSVGEVEFYEFLGIYCEECDNLGTYPVKDVNKRGCTEGDWGLSDD